MLRAEISLLLQRELKDPRLGFVTITGADVTPDLRHAKVYVSVMGTQEERDSSLSALNRARGFLRSELSKRAHLKTVPELDFREDEAAARGSRIFELLEEARKTESESEGTASDPPDTTDDGRESDG